MISSSTSRVPREDTVVPRLLPLWVAILPGFSLVLPGLLSALLGLSQAHSGAPRLVFCTPWCSQACHRHPQAGCWCSHVLPGAPKGHCICPVNSGIWPPWDSGPTSLRHSQRLPERKIYFADVAGGVRQGENGRSCVAGSVSNGSIFGPGQFHRSTWLRPYHINNQWFLKRTAQLSPPILITEFTAW